MFANREKQLEYDRIRARKYYQLHKKEKSEYCRNYNRTHKEKRILTEEQKEEKTKYRKEYNKSHKEHVKQYRKEYRLKHLSKEHLERIAHRKYLKDNPDIADKIKKEKLKAKLDYKRLYIISKGKYKKERNAASKLRYAIKIGLIDRLPCAICGNEKSEGHHPDYRLPLTVIFLCKKHHSELHRLIDTCTS